MSENRDGANGTVDSHGQSTRISNGTLRLGMIGLGLAGAGMLPAVFEDSRFKLTAVADPNPLLRERFAKDHDCRVFDSAEALMEGDCVDAVYIATPHQLHCEHVVLAATHGVHAVVEKPMALTLEDCDRMRDAVDRAGTVLIVGHTHSFDPAVLAIRDIIRSGSVGRLAIISMINYTDFLYRPRRPEELDTSKGGGILFNQIPHQVDTIRLLAGSDVTSVRAASHVLDPARPTEGCCTAFLEFSDGTAATLTYSGYDHFDSDEFHEWVGENGQPKKPSHGSTRQKLGVFSSSREEAEARTTRLGYGGRPMNPATDEKWFQPHFGTLIVTCEHADIRQTKDGIRVYRNDGSEEVIIPCASTRPGRSKVLDELYDAVVHGIAPVHNGVFGRGTLEACLAILESSRSHAEVRLGNGLGEQA
ncbi:MAG: Gfo/Idh/MocA family oxidoreductase [Paraburkholderia tropica]|uniref:Phthalate 4,5-cis-dihydrodiol dehydrogenase n=1 Tax=Paraburkholderia tropica TaxID=92647 RepID=A0ABX5MM72_9BURK|nr:Gfo/Idh/MocA family oxidoreductase [Paraburkholderia tropica]PXX12564.1 phthalate 4,5-cis-dihydrodiol dehydrogenase [Paraburkholderia tropica]PZW76541.1 phthalate 4,5-cis-dihydrodiol dehydrogenase [Paraburkholderia tropica]